MAHLAFTVQREKRKGPLRGFALRELLATIFIATLLAAMLSAWLEVVRNSRNGIVCLANSRQMMRAFTLYADEYNHLLPPNEDLLLPGHAWFSMHAGSLPHATNRLLLADPKVNLLAPYAPDPRIWKCPADPATIAAGRVRTKTIRSVAINCAVGTACPTSPGSHTTAPSLPTHGSWLDGVHGHVRGRTFRTFGRQSDFVTPSDTFVFIDEHPPSLNDGVFAHPGYDPARPTLTSVRWVDFPAEYHGRAAGMNFADGHAEIHKWKTLRYPVSSQLPPPIVGPSHRADWEWLALRATQPLR